MTIKSCLPFFLLAALLFLSCNEDDLVIGNDIESDCQTDTISIRTGLPIIEITMADGSGIPDKETWKAGTLIFRGDDCFRGVADSIEIKGRGNASSLYPKKSFTLKFQNKQSLLGLPRHKRWVFQANYHDRTLLRNALTFHLGHFADGMEWNPHAEFAEVIFNGEYIGNYLVCEQIRADKNRVPIAAEAIEHEDCGFIFEYDIYFDSKPRFHSSICHFPICIKYPDDDDCRDGQVEYARRFIQKVETMLFASDFEKLFDECLDLDSFVDYWIIMTITGNIEPEEPRSVYFYKKSSGKLYAGPLWDFDFSTYRKSTGTDNRYVLYYTRLFKSPVFRERVRERWQELSPILRQEASEFIMQERSYLAQSAELNYGKWPIKAFLHRCENGDELLTFQDATDRLHSITMARMDYVDGIVRGL